jgi:hypothetical protein
VIKNKIVIAVLVVAVLLIGGGVYLTLSKSESPTQKPQAGVKETPKASPESALSTLKSLLSAGKTESCVIEYPDNGGSGTFYVSGKKFAGEFTVKEQSGKEITGHTVSDGTFVYIWSSAMASGFKMKADTAINAASSASPQNGNVDFNQKVSYKCSPWTMDDSKFQVPQGIKFSDVSGLLNQTESSPSASAASPCDSITNAQAKAACESALKGQQ